MTDDDHTRDLAAHIGSALRERREQRGLTQTALAELAAVSQSAVAKIERGARAPSVDLQGAPVPVTAMEIALARRDCDAFTRWLDQQYAARWDPRFQEYGFDALDPRLPGEPRWRLRGGVIVHVRLVDVLPASIEVRHRGRGYRVLPLPEVEITDPFAARLLRRYRESYDRIGATLRDT